MNIKLSLNGEYGAHELHHSIQLECGYSVSGSPGNYVQRMAI